VTGEPSAGPEESLLRLALRLVPGAVVSFVGAGGKSSAMFRLASELRGIGWRVVTTTTTHLAESQTSTAPCLLNAAELPGLQSSLDQFGHCLIVGAPDEGGKVQGVSLELVASLQAIPGVDAVLVEADGSRLRSFKAPAEHEPVVPPVTTHLVSVVGIDVIGRALESAFTHRPEQIALLAAATLGSPITIETIARVMLHPEGGAKNRPPDADWTLLVNKVDCEGGMSNSRALAERLLRHPAVRSVLLGSMLSERPVREVHSRVAGIVLAAGRSSRFGATKQIVSWKDSTLVERAAQTALNAGLHPVVVVTGHDADRVGAAVAGLPVQVCFNAEFAAGLSTSVRKGIEALPAPTGAAVFLLADQPGATPQVVRAIVQRHRETLAPAVVPTYRGRRGNPVLFDAALFPELKRIEGDAGGRVLLDKHPGSFVPVPVEEPAILQDIDTREDHRRLQ
jgi:molybdenum cofactor cytidylyltransferase